MQHCIQRHEVNQSALIHGSPTLTEHLAMLKDITQRLEQDELASQPLMEKSHQSGNLGLVSTGRDELSKYVDGSS